MSAQIGTPTAVIPRIHHSEPASNASPVSVASGQSILASDGLEETVDAFVDGVRGDTGIALSVVPATTPTIRVSLDAAFTSPATAPLGLSPYGTSSHPDESYRLRTDGSGIELSAATPQGIVTGLATLRQLLATASVDDQGARQVQPFDVTDGPRYAWRGFKLDVARHFYPVDAITQVIDQLSRYKLNALSLHLVDNEGWHIAVDGHPELTSDGAPFYTLDDLAHIAQYARDRGVVVIPEIDFPGHCRALIWKHPEFGVLTRKDDHDIVYVDPRVPELWDFLRAVYGQVLTATGSSYLHIGGDEAFGMPADLFSQFVRQACALVTELGAQPICYQEGSRAGLATGTISQYWLDFAGKGGLIDQLEAKTNRGEELPYGMTPAAFPFYREGEADQDRAEQQQLQVIVSPTQRAYFDTPYREPSSDPEQEKSRSTLGLTLYAPRGVDEFSGWDPAEAFDRLDAARIAGVEAALWADTITDTQTMQLLLLPRLPGFAESVWSHEPRAWDEYRTALATHAPAWRAQGLEYFASSLVDWD